MEIQNKDNDKNTKDLIEDCFQKQKRIKYFDGEKKDTHCFKNDDDCTCGIHQWMKMSNRRNLKSAENHIQLFIKKMKKEFNVEEIINKIFNSNNKIQNNSSQKIISQTKEINQKTSDTSQNDSFHQITTQTKQINQKTSDTSQNDSSQKITTQIKQTNQKTSNESQNNLSQKITTQKKRLATKCCTRIDGRKRMKKSNRSFHDLQTTNEKNKRTPVKHFNFPDEFHELCLSMMESNMNQCDSYPNEDILREHYDQCLDELNSCGVCLTYHYFSSTAEFNFFEENPKLSTYFFHIIGCGMNASECIHNYDKKCPCSRCSYREILCHQQKCILFKCTICPLIPVFEKLWKVKDKLQFSPTNTNDVTLNESQEIQCETYDMNNIDLIKENHEYSLNESHSTSEKYSNIFDYLCENGFEKATEKFGSHREDNEACFCPQCCKKFILRHHWNCRITDCSICACYQKHK